jgi:hypothetical protein
VVVAEWSPPGRRDRARRDAARRHTSTGWSVIGAIVLVGGVIVLLINLPVSTPGYRRERLATFICESVGVAPGTARCAAVSIGGWFAFVVAVGVVLKLGRAGLSAVGLRRDER